jgi:hypothetical protein
MREAFAPLVDTVAIAIGMGDVGWGERHPCWRLTLPLTVMLERHTLPP